MDALHKSENSAKEKKKLKMRNEKETAAFRSSYWSPPPRWYYALISGGEAYKGSTPLVGRRTKASLGSTAEGGRI